MINILYVLSQKSTIVSVFMLIQHEMNVLGFFYPCLKKTDVCMSYRGDDTVGKTFAFRLLEVGVRILAATVR